MVGYKGEMIKEYFSNFYLYNNDYVVNLVDGFCILLNEGLIDWKVGVIDIGLDMNMVGCVVCFCDLIGDEMFCLIYGDGLLNINIFKLLEFYCSYGKFVIVLVVCLLVRFGVMVILDVLVEKF